MNILVWTLLLSLSIVSTALCELTLVKQDNQLRCFNTGDEDSSALAWILGEKSIIEPSSITAEWTYGVPSKLQSLSTLDHWGTSENKVSSLDVEYEENLGPVLDHRWNSLPLYRSDGSYTYAQMLDLPDVDNVEFHLSVLAKENAYIILSTGEEPYKDHVYWIIVDGWADRNRIAIRRCSTGVPSEKWPAGECETLRQNKTIYGSVLKDGKEWTHLTLTMQRTEENRTHVIVTQGSKDLIDWTDDQDSDPIKYLSFRTQDVSGYWRLHKYEFLQSTFGNMQHYLTSLAFEVSSTQSLCLSMTYFSPQHVLRVLLLYSIGQTTYTDQAFVLKSGSGWQIGKIEGELSPNVQYYFQISSYSQFYIGDIRVCGHPGTDSFVTTLQGEATATCAALKSSEYKIRPQIVDNRQNIACLGDSFGPECQFSCSRTLKRTDCSKVTACTTSGCSCLSGYYSKNCDTPCSGSYYGPMCTQHCSDKCMARHCNASTGHCDQCAYELNTGHFCEEQFPIVLKGPGVTVLSPTSLYVKVFTTRSNSNLTAVACQMQYKEKSESDWHVAQELSLPPQDVRSIDGLKSSTTYQVRTVIIVEGGRGYNGSSIPYSEATTTCIFVTPDDIKYTSTQDSVTITQWNQVETGCMIANYTLIIISSPTDDTGNKWNIKKIPFVFNTLQSDTTYTISIFHSSDVNKAVASIKVKTEREAPPKLTKPPKLEPLVGGVRVRILDTSTDTKITYVTQVLIQYKLTNETQWQNGAVSEWPLVTAVDVTNLHVLTRYHVRAILLEGDESGDRGEDVKFAEVETKCRLVGEEEITITSQHYDSITVDWKQDEKSCPLSYYQYFVSGYKNVTEIPFTITGLEPETDYTVFIDRVGGGVTKQIKQSDVRTLRDRGPRLKHEPILERALVDGAVLTTWTVADRNDNNVESLLLQYKLASEAGEAEWHDYTPTFTWPTINVTLRGLESNTEYQVRSVLIEKDGESFRGDDKDKIPELNFTTSCDFVDTKDAVLNSGPYSITINWKINKTSCPINFYDIYVNETMKFENCITFPCTVDKLKIETNYTVDVYRKNPKNLLYSCPVTTKRDRPPKLSYAPTLNESLVDGANIEIRKDVDRKTHDITKVLLQYKLPSEPNWHDDTQRFTWPPSTPLTLRGLESNTEYQVRAVLIERHGESFLGDDKDKIPELTFTTLCDFVDQKDLRISTTETSIDISWQLHATSCPLEFYKYSDTKNGEYTLKLQSIKQPRIVITGLDSDTKYFVNFYNANKNDIWLFKLNVTTQREPPPYFEEPPHITERLVDGFTLTLNVDKITYSTFYCESVVLQYKKEDEKDWKDGPKFIWPLQNSSLTLQSLQSDTTYQIRALLLEKNRTEISDDSLKFVTVTTRCTVVAKNEVKTITTTESITLDWSDKLAVHSCPINKYKFEITHDTGAISSLLSFTSLPITFRGEAGTQYKIRIKFVTKESRLDDGSVEFFEFFITAVTQAAFPTLAVVITIIILLIVAAIGAVFWIRRQKFKQIVGSSLLINNYPRGTGVVIPSELDLIPLPERSGRERNLAVRVRALPTPASDEILADAKAGASEILTHVVKLQELENYVEKSLVSGELKRQHGLFPRGQTQPWDYGRLPENKMKNRYANLVAYDATRVKLAIMHGDPHSDYINANYLDGYKHPRAYIATQGPKPVTVNDFWRMIWQENVNLIVMLANVMENGKKKCEQYWPDFGSNVTQGEITIHCIAEEIFADYTYRTFSVVFNDQKRKIQHFHFTTWPDHGVPSYPQSVASFLKKILTIKTTGPIVVHCSAGVGRTGTVILADACLRMASAEGQMDPLSLMQTMRSQRPNMVDNAEQYELVHVVLVECLLTDSFTIPCSQFSTQLGQMLAEHRSILDRQFSRLNKLCQKDAARKNMRTDFPWPEEKSRFPEIAPGTIGRVILNRPMGGGEYINAVYVDGFRTKGQFIATQLPLPDTVTDLWHLVDQAKVALIVVLNQPDPQNDQTTCKFWPQPGIDLELSETTKVVFKQQTETELFEQRSLQLQEQYKMQGEMVQSEHEVKVVVLKGWKPGDEAPASPLDLLELWEEVERSYTGDAPVIVMCHDGARACGLFLASVFVVEKMKLEKEVDVGLAVRSIRLTRPHFITSIDQFEYIHLVAQAYMDSFETYANFQ